ncbi:ketohydroxyglutarate aldolase [Olivibacter sitiensis]|uniref:ketohydroxyglutarate aldolase n=1 Tax=Olivibacter sitiensis TaxID=376470 RepID=UPI00040D2AC2|nr:ketohydroxyglutarate aldolase [Olivibacter sitiensis]
MKTLDAALQHILTYPILPVFYHDDASICLETIKACYAGGIRVFEFVNRGAKAKDNFAHLVQQRDEHFPEMLLGIGTIKSKEEAENFLTLGADFIVSPITDAKIAQVTIQKDILWIPGCMTPTEISIAEKTGAPLAKLFPGNLLGTDFLKAIKPLFPHMRFMPTGGVSPTAESIDAWFDAGVSAVGMGSKLFEKPADAEGYQWLVDKAKALTNIVYKKA